MSRRHCMVVVRVLAIVLLLGGAKCEDLITNPITEIRPNFTCSYLPYGYTIPGGAAIVDQPPFLSARQMQLNGWFNQAAIATDPRLANIYLPYKTLVGEKNARAGAFGVAINNEWFSELGESISTAVFAHELGHVAQAYNLIPPAGMPGTPMLEGQADYFAGYILKQSRLYSPAEMNNMALFIQSSPGSATHPAGPVRASLMIAGYTNAP